MQQVGQALSKSKCLLAKRFFRVPAMIQPEAKEFGVFKVYMDGQLFAWLVMDRPGKSENAIGLDFQDSIIKAAAYITEEYQKGNCKVCILTSAKKRFCVGADITEFYGSTDKADLLQRLVAGKAAMKKLSTLPLPTLAAINGDALGGGLELALACDYRVVAASAKHNLGLPETMLGVVPGLGGTVRTPRLIGLQNALTYILPGKNMKPAKAKSMGLVDSLLEDEDRFEGENRFLGAVRLYAGTLADKPKSSGIRKESWMDWFLARTPVGRYVVTQQTLKTLEKTTKGRYPAPYKAFESIMTTVRMKDIDKALEVESQSFADMCVSAQCKSLMSLFFLQERCKKMDTQEAHFSSQDAVDAKTIAVLGAGVMGSGIAHWAAKSKISCVMKDINDEAVQKGLKFVKGQFDSQLKSKKLDAEAHKALVARVKGTLNNADLKGCNVIIEAAVEVMEIKKKMVQELEAAGILDGKTIFATNTSALSINELASVSKYPECIVGMHFFNPVAKMPLIEVIKGEKTSRKAAATVYKLALDMGKFPVVVKDGPGFLVNRILGIYMSEAGQMLLQGADPVKVDKKILDFGMPMGPFRLLDEVGLDVGSKVGPTLNKGLGPRFVLNPVLDAMAKTPNLGTKTGKGFYSYDAKGKQGELEKDTLKKYGALTGDEKFNYDEVVDRCILAMVNEAARILEEKIAECPEDVDLGMVFGTGFAPFRGGLLSYADNRGIPEIVTALKKLTEKNGDRFTPASLLVQMAADKKVFFPHRPHVPMSESKPKPKVSWF
eukprot:GGOE01013664.1.p1 GENE.GGOE01013664.1~~GGOE01013664.1.p1  ORF type:complete len:785 (-),score=193.75 GGOE01013664.1:194-2521(-)